MLRPHRWSMLTAILPTGSLPPPLPRAGTPALALLWPVAFGALAVLWTWPLSAHLSSRIPHDPGDSVLNIWLIWWNAHAVPFTRAWWSPPIFVPMQGALALSEHLAGFGPLTTPLQWAGAGPLAAYNVAFVLSFALSGYFAFLLVQRLAGRDADPAVARLAGLCAGLMYGFGPYRAGQLAHLQVLTSQWMPLALLAMHAWLEDGRRRWLALAAAAWLVQALSNGYYLFFFPVLGLVWLLWFVDWRRRPSRGAWLIGTFVAASALLVPVLLTYARVQREQGLSRTPGEMVNFSARPDAFLHASGLLRFWPTVPAATTEAFLFPGITGIALLLWFWTARLRKPRTHGAAASPLLFYALAAVLMAALACGPAAAGASPWLRPYSALAWLPGFDALRVPARFAMLASLCLAVAAGLAFARLVPRRGLGRVLIAAGVLAGAWADGWMVPLPLVTPPGRVELPVLPGAAVVELPLGEGAVDTAAMYRAMAHRRPLVNGYSGHLPPHYVILSMALKRGDPTALLELARGRPLLILVNGAFDGNGRMRRLVEGLPEIEARGASAAGLLYVLPPRAGSRTPLPGAAWPASRREIRRFEVELDLGEIRTVRTIGFPLRWHYGELDNRMRIQGSENGRTFTTVWEDYTGGASVAAALEDPREAPVRLTLPDVRVRYVRIYPAAAWLQREIAAYGPR